MHDRLMTVASFDDPADAVIARNLLETRGITACLVEEEVEGEDTGSEIRLQVGARDIEQARSLLEHRHDFDQPADPDDVANVEAPIDRLADQLFRAAVLGALFWPIQLYALWLFFQVMTAKGSVQPERRWKVWAAALLIGAVALPLTFLFGCVPPLPRL